MFSLLDDKWLTVQTRSGERRLVAPWQITEGIQHDPIVAVAASRADFNGALVQFLIGLLQCRFAPKHQGEWSKRLDHPPLPEELRVAFAPVNEAFQLDGDGPRFMQDLTLREGERKEVNQLLIDSPGENALKKNTDHFVKGGKIHTLCPACAATALYTLQTNAPSGGQGHRTSLRGGGPLSTLVLGDTLWQTLWLNVLTRNDFENLPGNTAKTAPADIFPWLAPTRTSEKSGRDTLPQDVHPCQVFWGMPRRIRLDFEQIQGGCCDLCGVASESLVTGYITKNYGINYTGAWMHPLTPYRKQKDGTFLPQLGQPGGLSYRHWLALVLGDPANDQSRARVIETLFASEERAERVPSPRLWAFGYDMENMKARGWVESVMPILLVKSDSRERFEDRTGRMIYAASEVMNILRNCLRSAWFAPGSEVKGDLSFINTLFWESTENFFYSTLELLQKDLQEGGDGSAVLENWLLIINRAAEAIFDEQTQNGHFEASDPRRIALAWRDLRRFTSPQSKKLRKLLFLPEADVNAA